MADLINFTLPTIGENTDAKTMKQIKNYLFQLTEQMKFYLNNIDTDNFTDAYNQHLSKMATSQTSNSNQLSVAQQHLKAFENSYHFAITQAVDKITGNKGGYIVTLDTNNDGMPDDLRILSDTSNYLTSQKYWQFNREGLAYIEKKNGKPTSSLALSADGYIIGERVKGILGEFVTLEACTLNACNINACTGNFSGQVVAETGRIGAFHIDNGTDTYKGGLYADYMGTVHAYRTFVQPAYYEKENGSAGETWVFSSQHADVVDGERGDFYSTWYVTANGKTYQKGNMTVDGEVKIGNKLHIDKHIFDAYGRGIVNISDANLVLGLDIYNKNLNTYLEGGNVYLRHNGGGITIQEQATTRMTIDYSEWTFEGIDSKAARRDTIKSKGGFVLSANGDKSWMYLVADTVCVRANMNCDGNLRLSFKAVSGTIPLVVNSSGVITTSSSSKRYKENITEQISSELDYMKVLDIPVCEYNYKPEHKDKELVAGKQIGLIAEDVQKYFPNASILDENGQAENWQDRIILSALLGVCKKQQQEIDAMKKEIEILTK